MIDKNEILISADWQSEWQNLDVCEQAWQQVLHICKKRQQIRAIILAGDLKRAYNPIDGRVVTWWQHAIERAIVRDIEVIVVLGNHDKFAQHSDAENWLDVLRRAGANCFDKPGIGLANWLYNEELQVRVFVLPFCSATDAKQQMKKLVKKHHPNKHKDILIFHHDLKEAVYDRRGRGSDSHLSSTDLCADQFRYVIGGHIHFPQRFGEQKNVYYVGSPYCTDWGEANQRKRYLVVGPDHITSVHSTLPGWYDPSVAGFEQSKPSSWKGARVRITVSCRASENYGKRLERAQREAEERYPGAEIYTIPKFKDDRRELSGFTPADSDERKIKSYVEQSKELRQSSIRHRALVKYMLQKLSHFEGGLRSGTKIKFLWAKGKNYLGYETVFFDFRRKGLIVIQGINQDRGNKSSNGSGKTSLMNLIPVAWFGRTFKGQSHNHWSNRFHPKDQAYAQVCVLDASRRFVTVSRDRRPTLLTMKIDGKNASSGMKSTDREGTQSQIEQVTGFTWPTLANAVYIDRAIADAFLSGTKKQRTDVLSRFQNLERFERALSLVRKDKKEIGERIIRYEMRLHGLKAKIAESEKNLIEIRELAKLQVDDLYSKVRTGRHDLKSWKKKNDRRVRKALHWAKKLKKQHSAASKITAKAERLCAIAENDRTVAKEAFEKFKRNTSKKECPTCLQPVSSKWLRHQLKKLEHRLSQCTEQCNAAKDRLTEARLAEQTIEGHVDSLSMKASQFERESTALKLCVQTYEKQYNELVMSQHSAETAAVNKKHKIKLLKKQQHRLKKKINRLERIERIQEFSIQAFSRDGIPAFLNRQLCPVLNKAADYYSNLFCSRELQLLFRVDDGEFIPQVINDTGGADIEDQSKGERALAGLIASFALREVTPPCNLLILDEPGEGLDSPNVRQFARALHKLKKRFKTIIVITHNTDISSELAPDRVFTVIKRDGISTIS